MFDSQKRAQKRARRARRNAAYAQGDPRDVRAPHDGHGPLVEYRQVKVPMGRKDKTKVLNRYAEDGWTLVEIKSGGLFGLSDAAILTRPTR